MFSIIPLTFTSCLILHEKGPHGTASGSSIIQTGTSIVPKKTHKCHQYRRTFRERGNLNKHILSVDEDLNVSWRTGKVHELGWETQIYVFDARAI